MALHGSTSCEHFAFDCANRVRRISQSGGVQHAQVRGSHGIVWFSFEPTFRVLSRFVCAGRSDIHSKLIF